MTVTGKTGCRTASIGPFRVFGQREHNESRSRCQKNPLDNFQDSVSVKATYEHMMCLEGSPPPQSLASPHGDPGFRFRDEVDRGRCRHPNASVLWLGTAWLTTMATP